MTRLSNLVALLVVATLAVITSAYSTPKPTQKSITQTQQSTRATFLTSTAAACGLTFLSSSTPALAAKETDPAVKGTKADPEYQGCLSKCIYDCTKPKGMEQKSRAECIPECKTQCATSKAQLLLGEPKKD